MGAPGSGTPRDPARNLKFTPRHRFPTFALRLGPFGPEFSRRAPVCSENDAFSKRNGDLTLGAEFTFRCRRMLRRCPIFHRCFTFALRLHPFGSVFRNGAPVCSENDAFPERNRDLSFRDGALVCSENDGFFSVFPFHRKFIVWLQISRPSFRNARYWRVARHAGRIRVGGPGEDSF